jgi:uncharacterized membrane protein
MAVVGYGAAAHWAMATGQVLPALALMLLLAVTGGLSALRHHAPWQASGWFAAAAALVWLGTAQRGLDAIYLPPIMINALLFWGFARSLGPGRTPQITVFARLMDGELDEATTRYTRRATLWWSGFLGFLVIETVLLALWAPREVWSVFAHLINYLLLGLFFFIEYQLRRRCLPDHRATGFLGFVKSLARVDVRAAMRRAP